VSFGFDDLVPADGVVSFLAGGRVPIIVVPPSDDRLDMVMYAQAYAAPGGAPESTFALVPYEKCQADGSSV
jgi:hypothetical protein